MAKTPKPVAKPVEDPAPDLVADVSNVTIEYPRNLDRFVAAAGQVTRSGIEIKDQLTALLRQRHAAIEVFIDEQIARGLTLEEVIAFGSIETPLVPTVTTADGRVLVAWPFRLSIDDGD